MSPAKFYLLIWWVSVIIALILWYRDHTYDRVMAVLLFILGMIQLIAYGCYSMMDARICGRLTAILVYLMAIIVLIATLLYTGSSLLVPFIVIVSMAVVYVMYDIALGNRDYHLYDPMFHMSGVSGEHYKGEDCGLRYLREDGNPMFNFIEIVLFGLIIFAVWISLLQEVGWTDLGLFLFALGIIFLIIYTEKVSDGVTERSIALFLTYLVEIILVIWIVGTFTVNVC